MNWSDESELNELNYQIGNSLYEPWNGAQPDLPGYVMNTVDSARSPQHSVVNNMNYSNNLLPDNLECAMGNRPISENLLDFLDDLTYNLQPSEQYGQQQVTGNSLDSATEMRHGDNSGNQNSYISEDVAMIPHFVRNNTTDLNNLPINNEQNTFEENANIQIGNVQQHRHIPVTSNSAYNSSQPYEQQQAESTYNEQISVSSAAADKQSEQQVVSTDITTSSPTYELKITAQPAKALAFRNNSEMWKGEGKEIIDPRGIVHGRDGKNHQTSVKLQTSPSKEKYYIRCTLLQPAEDDSKKIYYISPHKLLSVNKSSYGPETELIEMENLDECNHQFKLNKYVIQKSLKKKISTSCNEKYEELEKSNKNVNGIKHKVLFKTDVDAIDCEQVRILFEAFQRKEDESYTLVAEPQISDCITDFKTICIVKNCNQYCDKNGYSEINILVNDLDLKYENSIQISPAIAANSQPTQPIKIQKKMLHANKAISFQVTPYKGKEKGDIECEIVVKTTNGQFLQFSNITNFTYTESPKWQPAKYIDDPKKPPKKRDFPKPDLSRYKKKRNAGDQSVAQTDYTETEELQQAEEKEESGELNETFENLRTLYEVSQNEAFSIPVAGTVRSCFEYYEQESPYQNSVLHDILQNDKFERCEITLYKIINRFHLWLPWTIFSSKNIYGETALMYACIFNKPLLIPTLIRMGCPIYARDLEDGNNVLHLISHDQSEDEIRKVVLKAMKQPARNDDYSPMIIYSIIRSFEKALKAYNSSGLTPLHIAVTYDNVALVEKFLEFCNENSALDVIECGRLTDGNTILHQAVLNKSKQMFSCILKYDRHGSILNLKNFNGNTAEEIIKNSEDPLISDLVHLIAAMKLDESE